jgi:hypothetical protein
MISRCNRWNWPCRTQCHIHGYFWIVQLVAKIFDDLLQTLLLLLLLLCWLPFKLFICSILWKLIGTAARDSANNNCERIFEASCMHILCSIARKSYCMNRVFLVIGHIVANNRVAESLYCIFTLYIYSLKTFWVSVVDETHALQLAGCIEHPFSEIYRTYAKDNHCIANTESWQTVQCQSSCSLDKGIQNIDRWPLMRYLVVAYVSVDCCPER